MFETESPEQRIEQSFVFVYALIGVGLIQILGAKRLQHQHTGLKQISLQQLTNAFSIIMRSVLVLDYGDANKSQQVARKGQTCIHFFSSFLLSLFDPMVVLVMVVVMVVVLVVVLVYNFAVRLLFACGAKYNINILGSYFRFVNDMALNH